MVRAKRRSRGGAHPAEVLAAALIGAVFVYSAFVLGERYLRDSPSQTLAERVINRIEVPVPAGLMAPRVMRTVYLNREGARLVGGTDDAQVNRSSIVAHAGLRETHVPAFAGPPARWRAITACIAQHFKPFDVRVVDQRPVGEDYVMAMMGGTVEVLGDYAKGAHHHALGLSPYNGKPIEDAVVLIFTRTAKEQTRKVCETAGMEIGHAYGLDHARNCRDLMTYMRPCGAKRFLDAPIPCGENADRACKGGLPTQNSYAHLLELLGPQALPVSAAGP